MKSFSSHLFASLYDSYVVTLIMVRLCGSTSHGFQQCVRRSASESKLVHSVIPGCARCEEWPSQFEFNLTISHWFRHHALHELNSLNLIQVMWSIVSEPSLNQSRSTAIIPLWARHEERLSWSKFNLAVSNWFRCHASLNLTEFDSAHVK